MQGTRCIRGAHDAGAHRLLAQNVAILGGGSIELEHRDRSTDESRRHERDAASPTEPSDVRREHWRRHAAHSGAPLLEACPILREAGECADAAGSRGELLAPQLPLEACESASHDWIC